MNEYDIGSKLRGLRKARNLTLRNVANEVGFSVPLLSQIEKNNISPPLATLSKLARFFNVSMASFFAENNRREKYVVVRRDDGALFTGAWRTSISRTGFLRAAFPDGMGRRKMSPFLMTLPHGAQGRASPSRGDESFLYVLEGALTILIHDHETVLETGDSIYFKASSEHTFFPADGREAVILEIAAGNN